METKLNVVVLSHTPDFEQNIVRGARLCYSSCGIEELKDKVTPEDADRFLNMILGIGHGSVLEHSYITFGIEGISRSTANQLVRHRHASYSQKSQRYVKEGQFEYVLPKRIKESVSEDIYIEHMENTQKVYDTIVEDLICDMIMDYKVDIDENIRCEFERFFYNYAEQNKVKCWHAKNIIPAFKEFDKKTYNKFEKIAIENARYVLPNACETKIQVTMNVRSLFNFFKERLCDRAQDEIREMAFEMWKACMSISPTIFKHAVPTCVNGKCKEGKMSCGKAKEYKEKYERAINEFTR